METKQLLYVTKIAEERSFSKAAKQLYITQPSLSHYICRFEKQLGVILFDRSTTPLTLTYAGKIFVEKARVILQQQEDLLCEMKEIAGFKSGQITIGISSLRGADLLPKILPAFKKKYPGIKISLIQENSKELIDLTCNGITDFSILPIQEKPASLTYDILQQEEILLALPPGHPLLAKMQPLPGRLYPEISLKNCLHETFILPPGTNLIRTLIDKLFEEAGFQPQVLLETNCITTAYSLVTAGLGICFWFSSIDNAFCPTPPVHCSLTEKNRLRTLGIAYKKGKYLTLIDREFIAMTKAVFR